jgi:hypothetical protein
MNSLTLIDKGLQNKPPPSFELNFTGLHGTPSGSGDKISRGQKRCESQSTAPRKKTKTATSKFVSNVLASSGRVTNAFPISSQTSHVNTTVTSNLNAVTASPNSVEASNASNALPISGNPTNGLSNSIGASNVLHLHRSKSKQSIPSNQRLSTHARLFSTPLHPSPTNAFLQSYTGSSRSSSSSSDSPLANSIRSRTLVKMRRRSNQSHSPALLGFYSPRSKSILKDAKLKYRIFIATELAFPTTTQAIDCATQKYNMTGDEYAADTETDREDVPQIDDWRAKVVSKEENMCIIL